MYPTETDQLTPLVSRVLNIEDITHGDTKQNFLMRYRGQLRGDSAAAYDQLAGFLNPLNITPLFRKEKDQHTIILMQGVIRPTPSKAWVNGVLFIATLLSVLLVGIFYALNSVYDGPPNPTLQNLLPYLRASLGGGLAYTASLLGILLAHEFGHYLAGRYHHTYVTLPYFLPLPIPGGFGTLGAFIQLKEPPKNRRILLDIGIAGPLAGLIVAIPVLLLGLALSPVAPIPGKIPAGQVFEGNSILYLLLKFIIHGQWLPQPASFNGMNPLFYWVRYFFTGQPLPAGGQDVFLHPIAWAGWAGLLVTALNLIPAGQLDGGHVMFVLLGRWASALLPFILGAMVLLGLVWPGWWLWAFLIFLFGRYHAEPLDQITPLDPPRRAIAVLGVIIFVLVFTPVPLLAVGI